MEPQKPCDFNDLGYWENFFEARQGKPFEWYGDFSDFAELLMRECGLIASSNQSLKILVPGCGNSELSAQLYDSGFKNIVNIDFSKKVVMEMLKKHVRQRPEMKWRVMDMTNMQFQDASFDIIIDKGGLDALLGDPSQDKYQAKKFLSEVQRLLVHKGKYVCITLAQSHVIELLFTSLRYGWSIDIHQVPQMSAAAGFVLKPFLVLATRDASASCTLVSLAFDATIHSNNNEEQISSLQTVIQKENSVREFIIRSNAEEATSVTSFEAVVPGRRVIKILGKRNASYASYSAVILDAPEVHKGLQYKCAVFLVPKGRKREWLFSSTEGQWQVVESAKSSRLIMIFLDTDFYSGSMEMIKNDLSPLVQDLLPADCKAGLSVPYLMCSDTVTERVILEEVESSLTGPIFVENVLIPDEDMANGQQKYYRRLAFRRNPNMIQSEALLIKAPLDAQKMSKLAKSKKNEIDELAGQNFLVDHSFLASPYHSIMIAGLSLIASNMEGWIATHQTMRVILIGLGAGLLPMFLHKHMPFQKIEVVELDDAVAELAKRHFGFIEDERMKLHIGDGLQFVKNQIGDVNVLIIDADSEDASSGMSCPPPAFLEESFLYAAKDMLCEGGILVINMVARARAPHITVPEKLLRVFAEVYSLEVEDDVNRVLFALPHKTGINGKGEIVDLASKLKDLALGFAPWGNGPDIHELAERLNRH